MEITCPTCKQSFTYKGGNSHFIRNKNHYCSRYCQNILHGMSRRESTAKIYDVYSQIKKRCKKSGVLFTITLQDMPEIPELCPVLGIRIVANIEAGPIDSSPSLDRIDPKLGYVQGNIRFISNRANRIKSDATLEEIKLVLKDAERIAK